MKKCIVIIPIYEANPDKSERASFRQTLHVLHSHDISIVTHAGCDLYVYKEIAQSIQKDVSVQLFPSDYFQSVQDYNRMCFSTEFYNRFSQYEYMLICQLDAWVFRDELDYWCDKGYDYIGAPIYHAYNKQRFTHSFYGIGNGGFCLRKISHCLRVINSRRHVPMLKPSAIVDYYINFVKYMDDFQSFGRKLRAIITVMLKCLGITNTLSYYVSNHVNEDFLFGTFYDRSWGHHCNLPSESEARAFSFEVNPEWSYTKLGRLPFGCHAFMKWDYSSFWNEYITINE